MRLGYLVLLSLFFIGCSTTPKDQFQPQGFAYGIPPVAPINQGPENDSLDDGGIKVAPQQNAAADLNDNETDMRNLPVEFNDKVNKWIEYFQGRGRDHMKLYLSRSSRYLPQMKEILKKHGLPEDLVYIALIESGFNAKALSRARAVGYWQFIRGTGRRYGLQQNYYIDERRDFVKSTEAAAKYFKALYNLFGSWYLAIASYNTGENRVKNLVMKYYTRDFWDLAVRGRLPRETINYVPKFLAARLIAKHPEKYGFDDVVYEPPLQYKEVGFDKGLHIKKLAKNLGISYKQLQALNPAYKRGVIPKRKGGTVVRVPTHLDDKLILAALNKSKSTAKMIATAGGGRSYRIRRGDTLSHIAQRFGTSIRALREANNLSRRSVLYPGKKLIIPTGRIVASKAKVVAKTKKGETRYRVRRGDNLYSIAKKFGVSINSLRKRNSLSRRSLLKIGKILVIPRNGASSRKRKTHHIVRRGENMSKIASRYNVSLTKLLRANRLSRRSNLIVGKKLVIP